MNTFLWPLGNEFLFYSEALYLSDYSSLSAHVEELHFFLKSTWQSKGKSNFPEVRYYHLFHLFWNVAWILIVQFHLNKVILFCLLTQVLNAAVKEDPLLDHLHTLIVVFMTLLKISPRACFPSLCFSNTYITLYIDLWHFVLFIFPFFCI